LAADLIGFFLTLGEVDLAAAGAEEWRLRVLVVLLPLADFATGFFLLAGVEEADRLLCLLLGVVAIHSIVAQRRAMFRASLAGREISWASFFYLQFPTGSSH
jgi:hypothetical protein